jgi:hypothetical protein
MATVSAGIRPAEVSAAARELAKMRRSLSGWLKYRVKNDQVAQGKVTSKYPPELAAKIVANERDWAVEQKLANHLEALLSEVMPGAALPNPDLQKNPNAAAQLAVIALYPERAQQSSAEATGEFPMLPWPVLIVGAMALVALTAISSYADVAKEKERLACVRAGACTDYGFWMKWGAILFVGWFAWEKVGVGAHIKRRLGAGKGREGTTT